MRAEVLLPCKQAALVSEELQLAATPPFTKRRFHFMVFHTGLILYYYDTYDTNVHTTPAYEKSSPSFSRWERVLATTTTITTLVTTYPGRESTIPEAGCPTSKSHQFKIPLGASPFQDRQRIYIAPASNKQRFTGTVRLHWKGID